MGVLRCHFSVRHVDGGRWSESLVVGGERDVPRFRGMVRNGEKLEIAREIGVRAKIASWYIEFYDEFAAVVVDVSSSHVRRSKCQVTNVMAVSGLHPRTVERRNLRIQLTKLFEENFMIKLTEVHFMAADSRHWDKLSISEAALA